jgi:uncharacterized RDD family membrane protein YckC
VTDAPGLAPGGFWRRYAAWSLDWLLLGALLLPFLLPLLASAWQQAEALVQVLQDFVYERVVGAGGVPSPVAMSQQLLADPALAATVESGSAAIASSLTVLALFLLGVSAIYFVGFEASPWQATPGKRAARLRVRATDGGEAGFARALLRHFAGAISWLLLNLGHAIAGWRRDRRALHDLIAGTQVLAQGAMPRWARWWLIAQAALLAAAFLGTIGWFAWQLWRIASAA